jgi:HSP20 family molecular chaperone IbpA
MAIKKRSFFERLTGSSDDEEFEDLELVETDEDEEEENMGTWMKEEAEEAELTVDVYQTPQDIIVQAMVAGVKPEHLELTIARDMITIKGKREETKVIDEDNFFVKELYWGTFSRTLLLPQEVEPEEAEATEKHGLLTIKLPKIDKEKKRNVKVKSV